MYNKQCIHIDKKLRAKTMEKREKREMKPSKQESSTREAECNKIKKVPKKHQNL